LQHYRFGQAAGLPVPSLWPIQPLDQPISFYSAAEVTIRSVYAPRLMFIFLRFYVIGNRLVRHLDILKLPTPLCTKVATQPPRARLPPAAIAQRLIPSLYGYTMD
jgi:hypothetical protein